MTEVVTTTIAGEQTFISDVTDGATGVIMLKENVVLNTLGKRVGASLPGAILGALAYSKLAVAPGLRKQTPQVQKAVKDDIFLSKIML